MMRARRSLWFQSLALALAVLLLPVEHIYAGPADAIALRMQDVLRGFVASTGSRVAGFGSWISLKNFRHGSDFDMRFLVPKGTSQRDAMRAWMNAREQLARGIRAEFGSGADAILRQTNLYPPTQLMDGVENSTDALMRFRRWNAAPCLAPRKVGEPITAKLAEGLYGPGADHWTQSYEGSAGRLFMGRNGEPVEMLCKFTHFEEGFAKRTIAGAAHTATQWAGKAGVALRGGDSKATMKHMYRCIRDLRASRRMAGMTVSSKTTRQLMAMMRQIKNDPRALRNAGGAIRALLAQAELEASLLKRAGSANLLKRIYARLYLESVEAGSKLGEALQKACQNVRPGVVIKTVFAVVNIYMVKESLTDKDYMSAYDWVASGIGSLATEDLIAGLAPALTITIVRLTLDMAKDCGHGWVAGRQDAFDLLEGVFTNVGVAPRKYTIDELVRHIHTDEGLRSFVWKRSQEAADRGFGPKNKPHDLKTGEAIYRRCMPVILFAWRWQRGVLMEELAAIMESVDANTVFLAYAPNPPVLESGVADVRVEAVPTDPDEGAKFRRSREILRLLLGVDRPVYANSVVTWRPHGRVFSAKQARAYQFPKGTHAVHYEQRIGIGAVDLPFQSHLRKDIVRRSYVLVRVGDRPKIVSPPRPPRPGTRWRPPHPEISSRRLGRTWKVDGPHAQDGNKEVAKWNVHAVHNGTPFTVWVVAVYTDFPGGLRMHSGYRWDPEQERLAGTGTPIKLPYGDEGRRVLEGDDKVGNTGRDVLYAARWGQLVIEVTVWDDVKAGVVVPWDKLRSVVHHVLADVARQLEPLRPKK